MLDRRALIATISLVLALGHAPSARASEAQPFDPAAFAAAQASGKPILVEVSAPWCPTCRAQKPILAELAAQPKFRHLQVFEVDFDSQKDALRALNARQQSTLIVFKGPKEVGRSTGDTNRASIEDLLSKAL